MENVEARIAEIREYFQANGVEEDTLKEYDLLLEVQFLRRLTDEAQ